MVRLTLLARITDGLPLAEGLEDDQNHDLQQFKQQAKVSQNSAFRQSVSYAQTQLLGVMDNYCH